MATRTAGPTGPGLPLVVTGDQELLDDLLRLAAVAGTDVDVASDPAAARRRFRAAPLVLVGIDQAQACLRARLPRRSGLAIVGRAGAAEPPWQLAELVGAAHVAMLPAAEPWLVDRLADCLLGSQGDGRIVAVIGGRGGAGATILAAALAFTAGRLGFGALLVDGDPLGGGLDIALGWEELVGLRWSGLSQADGRVDAAALVDALPRRGDLVILSFDRGDHLALRPEAMTATLEAGRRARDLVVVDLPRQLDDAAVVALQLADRTLLVVPAELRAVAAAGRVARMVTPHCEDLSVVVRGPSPGGLKADEVIHALGLPLAGTLRPEPRLAPALERGEAPAQSGRGPLATLCQRLVTELVEQRPRAVAA
ncbi:MAG TPA: septum site-determining protein Ssd [Micromonosporaceae bacterium]|jgi:secretion/DNA translocation related CpaE-like protein